MSHTVIDPHGSFITNGPRFSALQLRKHWLYCDGGEFDVDHREIARPGYSFTPSKILLHYDVCSSIAMNTRALFASGLSYHVAVNGMDFDKLRPRIRQYIPGNKRAVHAKGFNDSALALCIVNPGPLIRCSDGALRTTYDEKSFRKHGRAPTWPDHDAVEATHASGLAPKTWTHWARYSYEERDAVLEICRVWLDAYPTIHTICGHDFTDPGRKYDPGPAFEDSVLSYVRGEFSHINVPSVAEAA